MYGRPGRSTRRSAVSVLALVLAVVTALGSGCGGEEGREDEGRTDEGRWDEGRPNVILVTIDTLRADRVSAYGIAEDTTPFLDELAADGVLFTRAYSTSSWTVPSVASLLSGLHPATHGVVHGQVGRTAERPFGW